MFVADLSLNMTMKRHLILFLSLFLCTALFSAGATYPIKLNKLRDNIHYWNVAHPVRNYDRLDSSDVAKIADNFIAWQNPDGGWPKDIDWLAVLDVDSVRNTLDPDYKKSSLDDRNTWPQIEYLSEAYLQSRKIKYKDAAEKGLHYILTTQTETGGWGSTDAAITYNNEVMTGIMNLFIDIKYKKRIYSWIKEPLYKQICYSLNRAVSLTLRCQIMQEGVKTGWSSQHDKKTLEPIQGTLYEYPAVATNESCDVLVCLMRIKDPSEKIVEAVEHGVSWLEKSKITDMKLVKVKLPSSKVVNEDYPYDIVEKADPKALPLWARYYEIDTNKPFMYTRQGSKVYTLTEVNPEWRVGYTWYGTWPEKVLAIYEKWEIIYGNKE